MMIMNTPHAIAGICLLAASAWSIPAAAAMSSGRCGADALRQAPELLAFHVGTAVAARARVAPRAEPLPSIVNPADRRQRFDVLQVWADIDKGRYRMRFEYYRMPDGRCLLMGQEILEYASP